ncbi:MAG: phosphatidylserine decarboxylase family protein [Desulfotomaculum sp.]|nr:phosphatidylserine decarboxylase family protein [Desulfotomaculum sp.]
MNKRVYPIAQDGWLYMVVLAGLIPLFSIINPLIAIIPAVLFFFVAFFFRNPKRTIPQEKDIIISPADGVVLSVEEFTENEYLKGKALKVKIFLSVFNVHINRVPVAGTVQYRSYFPGKFLPAFKGHASDVNERNYVGIDTGAHRIMVTQVTGFIARRIVCWIGMGDQLNRGQIFGLIKFGSCTELYLPLNTKVLVKKGDKVRGGETIIGRFPE